MILIGGTSLKIEQLPMYDIMEYQIESGQTLAIKLKTVAKAPNCFNIYLHDDLRTELTITEDIFGKVVFYSNDEELLNYLNNGGTEKEDVFSEETEVPEFEQPVPKEPFLTEVSVSKEQGVDSNDLEFDEVEQDGKELKNKEETKMFSLPDLEEVNTELPDVFLKIPNIGEDTDSLKVQLENKEKLIKQKESIIKDLNLQIENAYKLQEINMLEIKKVYDEKIEEANAAISELKEKATGFEIDADSMNFLKFASYSKNYKAALREGFTENERKNLGKLNSSYSIFACSSGDSLYSMMKQIKKYMDGFPKVIIVDFSNDHYLNSAFKLKSKYGSMDISKITSNSEIDIMSIFQTLGGNTRIAPHAFYNDISLLSMDWVDVIKRIDAYAGGLPVILLFNNINSFSVRYTVSKLATVGKLFIFAKCAPIILTALLGDVQFIPEDRVTIIALEYIKSVETILSVISKKFPTTAFANDVEWNKLILK